MKPVTLAEYAQRRASVVARQTARGEASTRLAAMEPDEAAVVLTDWFFESIENGEDVWDGNRNVVAVNGVEPDVADAVVRRFAAAGWDATIRLHYDGTDPALRRDVRVWAP